MNIFIDALILIGLFGCVISIFIYIIIENTKYIKIKACLLGLTIFFLMLGIISKAIEIRYFGGILK